MFVPVVVPGSSSVHVPVVTSFLVPVVSVVPVVAPAVGLGDVPDGLAVGLAPMVVPVVVVVVPVVQCPVVPVVLVFVPVVLRWSPCSRGACDCGTGGMLVVVPAVVLQAGSSGRMRRGSSP